MYNFTIINNFDIIFRWSKYLIILKENTIEILYKYKNKF